MSFQIPAVPFTPSIYQHAPENERIFVYLQHSRETQEAARAIQRSLAASQKLLLDKLGKSVNDLAEVDVAEIKAFNDERHAQFVALFASAVRKVKQGPLEQAPPVDNDEAVRFWLQFGDRFVMEVYQAILMQMVDKDHRGK
jgi:hypothetical protein